MPQPETAARNPIEEAAAPAGTPTTQPILNATAEEREYTREEMRQACRNNYNAALLEAAKRANEMAKSGDRSAATALRLFAHSLYELLSR